MQTQRDEDTEIWNRMVYLGGPSRMLATRQAPIAPSRERSGAVGSTLTRASKGSNNELHYWIPWTLTRASKGSNDASAATMACVARAAACAACTACTACAARMACAAQCAVNKTTRSTSLPISNHPPRAVRERSAGCGAWRTCVPRWTPARAARPQHRRPLPRGAPTSTLAHPARHLAGRAAGVATGAVACWGVASVYASSRRRRTAPVGALETQAAAARRGS